MPRAILHILVVCMLLSNLAWAADTSGEALFGHSAGNLLDGNTAPHDTDDGPTCDHCCHGIAHLLGVPPVTASLQFIAATDINRTPSLPYHSLTHTPPLHPPRI